MTRLQRDDTNQGTALLRGEAIVFLTLCWPAVQELMKLLGQQSKAIIENDTDFARFDDLIHVAQNAKNDAKYALLAHIHEHGCE
ncbi:MAG: hypothetical protein WDO73_00335 [Ignavibacteriota bacterium]